MTSLFIPQIENGYVRLTVEHEFEVTLTLMGDSPSEVWRLLEVDITVEDKETGEGKALVHPLQVRFTCLQFFWQRPIDEEHAGH